MHVYFYIYITIAVHCEPLYEKLKRFSCVFLEKFFGEMVSSTHRHLQDGKRYLQTSLLGVKGDRHRR